MSASGKVLGFGAVLWDDIADGKEQTDARSVVGEKNIGGAVFNVVAHMQKLGYDSYMLSAIGNDKLGERTFQELARLCVNCDFIGVVDEATCLIRVSFDRAGQPQYSCPDVASWDAINVSPTQINQIEHLCFDFFVFGTLEQRNPTSHASLLKVLDRGCFKNVYLDLTLRGNYYSRELLEYSMRKAHIVKMNEEEALIVRELFGFKEGDLGKLLCQIAKEFGNQIACITLACRGALIGDRSTVIHKPAYKVCVEDTVGSGDAFSAGLLYMLGKDAPLDEACDFANRMGALISSKKSSIPAYDIVELERLE